MCYIKYVGLPLGSFSVQAGYHAFDRLPRFHTMRSKPGHISESVPDFVNNYFRTVYTSYIIFHYSIRMKGSGAVNRHLSLHRSPFSLSSFQNARKLHCRIAVEFSCIYPPEIRFIPPDYFDGMKKRVTLLQFCHDRWNGCCGGIFP